MNPFLQMVRNQAPKKTSNSCTPNIWEQKMEDLKSGKADPKQTALEFVRNLNPKQKTFLKLSLPMFQKFAMQNGASDDGIKSFITEVRAVL